MEDLKVNSIVYVKLTGEPIFVLGKLDNGEIEVRRFIQHRNGNEYVHDFFRPEELSTKSPSPLAAIFGDEGLAPEVIEIAPEIQTPKEN